MHSHRRTLVAVTAFGLVLAGCNGAAGDGPGVSTPIGDEPLADSEVTLHLMEPPSVPPELDGAEFTTSELRAPDLTERHTVELVDVPVGVTSVAEAPPAGAFYRVVEGETVEIGAPVDTVPLIGVSEDGAELGAVSSGCAAPCSVVGPALIGADGWMTGFGVASSWLLLVPSPIS